MSTINMPAKKHSKRKPKIPKTLKKEDALICKLVDDNPHYNNNQIGGELVKQGVYSNSNTIYRRLKACETLDMTVKQLREYHMETFIRDNIPIATKNVKKGLRDKKFKKENPKDFYKLSLDTVKVGLGHHDEPSPIQQQINIGQIQAVIQDKIAEKSSIDADN